MAIPFCGSREIHKPPLRAPPAIVWSTGSPPAVGWDVAHVRGPGPAERPERRTGTLGRDSPTRRLPGGVAWHLDPTGRLAV